MPEAVPRAEAPSAGFASRFGLGAAAGNVARSPVGACGHAGAPRRRLTPLPAVALWPVVLLLAVGALAAQDPPRVVLSGIEVTPAAPGAETLCKLTATIGNSADRAVYAFGFDVELNGQPLPVYEKQLFLQVIEAGETEEVALFNFWTSETGRPAPADGKLDVLVRLREARWVEVTEVEEDGETVEVWTPLGDVAGLPQAVSLALELK